MSTRKVKDAKDLETDEKIYFKGHAKATFMSDGRTVEDAIKQAGNGGGGSSSGSSAMVIYEHVENDTTMTIEPNTYHKWGEVRELTISLGEPANLGVVNEYMFSFDNISLTPQLTIDELMWEHGEYPEFTFLAKNVVKIMDGLAKIESYALSEIILSDSYSYEDREKAVNLYYLILSGDYAPGDYLTNGAPIYVHIYSETEGDYIYEKVTYFRIPMNLDESYISLCTENGKRFHFINTGEVWLQ